MDSLPADWLALCAFAFALGARHGLDADHLAAIDGIARCNARSHPRLARGAGALFSLGHGAIVLVAAAAAFAFASRWTTPAWLETSGALVSIAFLYGLAALNLHSVIKAAPDAVVVPAGIRGRLFGRIVDVESPWAIAAVGALFAVSFDTISQAALFALAASRMGGMPDVLFVAGLFVAGMVAVDGINGLWISRMLRRADRTAAIASRIMALSVAAIGIAIGSMVLARWALPGFDAWSGVIDPYLGAMVIAAIVIAYASAIAIAARRRSLLVQRRSPD